MPSVGTAYVNIRVNTSGFEGSLDSLMKKLSAKMEAHGTQLGKDFERGFKKTNYDSISKGLPDAVKKGVDASVKEFDRFGNAVTKNVVDGTDGAHMVGEAWADTRHGIAEATDAMREFGTEATKAKNAGKDIDLTGGGGGGRAGSGFRSGGDGASFFSGQLKNLRKEADGVWPALNKLYTLNAFLGTALAGLVGSVSAVAQGLFVLASQAAAVGPAFAVAASGMLALAQVGGTLMIAMKGVGEALKLGSKSMDATAKAGAKAADNSKAIAAAARALRDAQDALGDAYRDAARAAEDAARKTLRAEQALAASQGRLLAAQEALNEARKEALEQLEDIGFAAEDAALAEQRAALRLQEAHAELLAVSELAPDNRARIEAELAFKEAELNMRQAKDAREDADRAQQEAAKNGVEGTDAMRDARAEEASAAEEVAQNQQDLADARRDEAEQAEDSADRIAEAQQRVADAQERLAEAYKGTATGATAAATAANAYAAAMAKLGPNQREFVESMLDMRDEMQAFRNAVAEPMFDRLNTAFDIFTKKGVDGKNMLDVFQTGLIGTGKALGDTAIDLATLAANPAFQGTLASAMDQNNEAIGNFGAAGVALANVFVQLADAAGPVLIEFSEWIQSLAEGASASLTLGNQSGELGDKIQGAADKAKEFWNFGVALWDVLHTLGTAANEAADGFGAIDEKSGAARGFIPTLTDDLQKLNDKLNESGENASIVERFGVALDNMSKIGGAIWNVVDPLLKMGSDPRVGEMADKLAKTDAFDKLADTALDAGPALTDLAIAVGDILAAMSESGSTKTFLTVLSTVAGWFADIANLLVGNPIGKGILLVAGTFFGLYRATKLIAKIGIGLFKPMIDSGKGAKKFMTDLPGNLKGAFKRVSDGFKGLFSGQGLKGFKAPPKDPAEENKAKANGKAVTDKFAEGIRAGLPEKDAAMAALEANVISEFSRMAPALDAKATATGAGIIDGLVLGLKEGTVEINTAGEAAGRAAANAVGKGAQTQSPSRLTIKTGDDIMEGLELGIREGMVEAELAAKTAGGNVARAVGTGAAGAKPAVAAAGAAAVAPVGGVAAAPPAAAVAKGGKFAGVLGSLGKVAGPLTKLAKPLAGGMRLIGGAMRFMMGPWGMIAMTLIPIILPLLKKLDDKFHIVDKIMAGLSWTMEKLSDAFTWLWDNVLKPVWDWLKENGAKVWDKITEAIEPLKEGLQTFWDLIQDAFNWIKDHWKLILGILTGPLGLAILAITENWDKIKEVISAAIDWITDLFTGMWDGIKAAWDTIWGWFSTLWENIIKPVLTDIIDGWKEIFSGIWDGIKTAWDTIVGWLSTLWENVIKPIIQTQIDGWKLILSTVWDAIKTGWDTIVGWLTGLWENVIRPIIVDLVDDFKLLISRVWNGLKTGWTIISTWVTNFWRDKLKPKITFIVGKGKELLATIWNGIKTGWTTISTWISNLWTDKLKPKIDTLKKNMSDGLKGIWDGMKTGLAISYNWVAEKVNDYLIGNLNKILGVFSKDLKISEIGENLPGYSYAKGGPVRGPGTGTSDSIPARLSNGEYVIPSKASKKLGPEALNYMRKHGELPPMGGWGLFSSIGDAFTAIKDVMAQGAKKALQWAISKFTDALGNPSNDNFATKMVRGALAWGADKIVGWGANKDESGVTGTATTGVIKKPGFSPLWNWPAERKGYVSRGTYSHGRAWAIDFAVPAGTRLLAASSGTVRHAGWGVGGNSTYGQYVQIKGHPTGQSSLYAHMSRVSVKAGQRVVPGQILGLSGSTGHSTGPHLHFELRPEQLGSVVRDMKHKGIYIGTFAQGGVVSPQGGGIMAMIGEAGKSERVTPLDREGFTPAERKIIATLESKLGGGGGGDTYQIHPSEKMNEAALADLVARRVAWKRRRGASR